ncbi:MAG: alpha/beta hydrolase [Betaproteobacteria bacterium]|nr:alpha/beta hydrolase [Betaproteobacteria bacterium]
MQKEFIIIDGHRLETAWIGAEDARKASPLVLLHEGLGSISLWKDFPQRLAKATQRPLLVYSRYGYGESDVLTEPRLPSYMHHEALTVLPQLLDALEVTRPVFVGHSDGATIALIYAAESGRPVDAIVAMAPHEFVEEKTLAALREAREFYKTSDLPARLGRHHQDADRTFYYGWNDIWLSPEFRDWDIRALLPSITCPVLALQGIQDEYASMEQIDVIGRSIPGARLLKIDQCGHSPQRDQPQAVIDAIAGFLRV